MLPIGNPSPAAGRRSAEVCGAGSIIQIRPCAGPPNVNFREVHVVILESKFTYVALQLASIHPGLDFI